MVSTTNFPSFAVKKKRTGDDKFPVPVPFPPVALTRTDGDSLALAVPLTIVWLGVSDQGWVVYVAGWTPRGLGLQHVAHVRWHGRRP